MTSCTLSKTLLGIEECINELKRCFSIEKTPITDDSTSLHCLEEKLEITLQLGLKDKPGVFGVKSSFWDYICTCFSSSKRLHEGIKFVKSNPELKSSLGRGRALIRFCLTQKCLADTLQTCFIDHKTTRDFYCERCLPLQPKLWSSFITYLYDLNELNFDLNPQNSELDVSWPSFSRKIFLPENQVSTSANMNSSGLNDFPSEKNGDESTARVSTENEIYSKSETETHHLVAANSELEADVLFLQKKCESLEKEICSAVNKEQDVGTVAKDVRIYANENAANADSKVINNNYYRSNSINDSKDCSKSVDMGLYIRSDTNVQCNYNLQTVSSHDISHGSLQGDHVLENSHSYSLPEIELISPELVLPISEFYSSPLSSINGSNLLISDKIDSLIQTETTPFHPEVSISVNVLVLEMKVLLDNLKNSSSLAMKDPVVLSHITQLKVIRDYLEKILSAEFKKLDLHKTKMQGLEVFASSLKSLALRQDCLIHSLLERVNLSVKGNESLYDRLCFLKDKLHSFGLLRFHSDCNPDLQMNSENIFSNAVNVTEDYINVDVECSDGMSNECLETLQIFKSSSAKLNALNAQAATLQVLLDSSHKLNNNLISRVQDQEMHMRGITKELEEAHHLLSVMRKQHKKLQSAENIVKYDLQEKRRLLTKLKQQLEETREDCNLVRLKNSKSEVEWQSLRKEFVQRNKQNSEESGFIDDKSIEDQSCSSTRNACDSELVTDSEPSGYNSIELKYDLKRSRLQLLEEQCQILCTNLRKSSKKRKEIDYRLETWCKAIEKSRKDNDEPDKLTETLNSNVKCRDGPMEVASEKIGIDSSSDAESSLSSSEIGSLNSDCSSCMPYNSTTITSETGASLQSLKTDLSISSELVNSESNQTTSPFEDIDDHSVDSESTSKAIGDINCSKSIDNVRDISCCDSVESLEEIDEYVTTNSVISDVNEVATQMQPQETFECTEKKSASVEFDVSKMISKLEEEKKKLQTRSQELEIANAMILNKLSQKTQELRLIEEAKEREITAVQFQLNSEVLKYERAIQEFSDNNEGLKDMKQKVSDQEQLILTLEEALTEIQMERESEKEQQWEQLQDIQLALSAREEECISLSTNIEMLEEFKKSSLKDREMLEVEIMHLRNDTKELQKKIIRLLKEKDILWKTNDRLRYLHKIQVDDRWVDDHEVSECLGCRSHFSFLLRKHHCRQCGRIFCNSCSNNWLLTPSSRRQIRVCNECYMQHMEIKKDVRKDSNVQYFDDSEDEAVVDDVSLNIHRSSSFISEIHPNIGDSIVSLPVMQVTNLKQKSHFTSAPQLHFNQENPEVPTKSFLNDPVLFSQMEIVENDISGNLLIKANEEAILPILNEVNSTSIAWSFEPSCEAIPISLVYEDKTHCSLQQTVLHQSSCETQGQIHLSLPGLYKFHFDNKSRSNSMSVHYSFKANILKEPEIFS